MKREFLQNIKVGDQPLPKEVIDAILDEHSRSIGAIKAEKDRADALKSDADLAKDLQAKLDAIEAEKLSDVEKANKATEKANSEISELKEQIKYMQTKTKLAECGIVGDQADNFFDKTGNINFDVLRQIISDREKIASETKEKEILAKTPNPGGTPNGDKTTEAETFAKSFGQSISEGNKITSDVLSHYV